ncbi:DUF2318 domain-containing protein [Patescibacteria group bacterium]|nr:DUF2318 domain-containing protein [Patescibacteria group bacterium]MBU1934771.1 DUF2318 domain-containing protein [Patescibacteria group bacterium]
MKKLLTFILISTFILAGCADVDLSKQTDNASANSSNLSTTTFRGEKGEYIPLDTNGIVLEIASVDDGKAHFFNTTLPNGEPVYFFVVKSPDGKLRAAANGCQVCGDALQGFHQEGDYMVCNTCGNRYPLDRIATEKGGCNPAPISPNLEVVDGNISIPISDLQDVRQFFE